MTPRRRRLWLVIGILAGVSIAAGLGVNAFMRSRAYYLKPTEVAEQKAQVGEFFRLGGMVKEGSVRRVPGSLEVHFVVTDFEHEVPVTYARVLPDLFREGAGVVAQGRLGKDGTFVAEEVLAKHDEKYMPPGMANQMKRRHGEARSEGTDAAAPAPADAAHLPPPASGS